MGAVDRPDVEKDPGESSPWPVGHPSLPSQTFLRASLEQDGQGWYAGPGASSCLGFPRGQVQLVHPSVLAVLSSSQAGLHPAVLRAFQ